MEKEEYTDCSPVEVSPEDLPVACSIEAVRESLRKGSLFYTVRPSNPYDFANGLETLYRCGLTQKFSLHVVPPTHVVLSAWSRLLMIVTLDEEGRVPAAEWEELEWESLIKLVEQTPMPDKWPKNLSSVDAWVPFLDPYGIDDALEMLREIDESDPLAGVESLENPQPAPEAEPVMHKPTAAEIKAAEVQPTWLMVEPGYEPLFSVLKAALDQAQAGKGKERHANGRAFVDQPILTLTRLYGLGYPMGQAAKKSEEALRLPKKAAQAELLGAINYLAAAYLRIGEEDHEQ